MNNHPETPHDPISSNQVQHQFFCGDHFTVVPSFPAYPSPSPSTNHFHTRCRINIAHDCPYINSESVVLADFDFPLLASLDSFTRIKLPIPKRKKKYDCAEYQKKREKERKKHNPKSHCPGTSSSCFTTPLSCVKAPFSATLMSFLRIFRRCQQLTQEGPVI